MPSSVVQDGLHEALPTNSHHPAEMQPTAHQELIKPTPEFSPQLMFTLFLAKPHSKGH